MSGLPWFLAAPLAALAACHGVRLGRAELRRPVLALAWTKAAGEIEVERTGNREAWRDARIAWRGNWPRVAAIAPGGKRTVLHWWPDTISAASRRRLRLLGSSGKPS